VEPRDEVTISAKRHDAQSPMRSADVAAIDDPITAQIAREVWRARTICERIAT
jgi:hypothetical protein